MLNQQLISSYGMRCPRLVPMVAIVLSFLVSGHLFGLCWPNHTNESEQTTPDPATTSPDQLAGVPPGCVNLTVTWLDGTCDRDTQGECETGCDITRVVKEIRHTYYGKDFDQNGRVVCVELGRDSQDLAVKHPQLGACRDKTGCE